ncbi:MAG: hypothetical protein AAGF82_10925 [Pseudomonadota bacterium]
MRLVKARKRRKCPSFSSLFATRRRPAPHTRPDGMSPFCMPFQSHSWVHHQGSGFIHLDELVGMNLFRYEAQRCRKPSGFQGFATTLPGKFTLSLQDAKTASICTVKPLNRAESPLVARFLAAHRRLLRQLNQMNEF